MSRSEKFWNKKAPGYAEQPVANEAVYQKKLEITRGYFRPDMEVLEFGCGTGSTAIAHAPYVKHIRATDFSSKMIEIAKGRAEAADVKNVTFEQSTVDDLSVPDGSLDAVLGLNILHLLKSPETTVAKVYAMLKPGGIFVTSTVCLGDMMWVYRLGLPAGHFLGLFPMLSVFTRDELTASLTAAGFQIDHEWLPDAGKSAFKALFIVAKKPG